MKSAALKFALLSLGLHALGFMGVSEQQAFEKDTANADTHSGNVTPMVFADIMQTRGRLEHGETSDKVKSRERSNLRANSLLTKAMPKRILDAQKPERENERSAPLLQDYFTAGKLTRLPSPITNIDLDVDEIKEVAFSGLVRLTILINADGSVIQVLCTSEDDALQAFSERVAEIFKRARFSPGEVDGIAVKAQLEINIVSESIRAL